MAEPATSQCGFYGAPFGPADAVYDSGTGQVFVSDSETNVVYVISPVTNTVVRLISLGASCVNPFGLAYDVSLGDVFVAEAGPGAVAAISDSNDSVRATYPVGGQPWNIAYDSGADQLFVTEPIEGNVTVVSLPTGAVAKTISEGRIEQPLGVAYAPESGEIFVANYLGPYSDTLTVISDGSLSILATVPIGCTNPVGWPENPYGVVNDPASDKIFASCLIGTELAYFSPFTNSQLGTVALGAGTTALAVNPDDGAVWAVAPFSDEAYVVSDVNDSVVAKGAVGGEPFEGIAVDPLSGNAYVPDWKSSNVTVLAPNASVVATIELPTPPAPPLWSPTAVDWAAAIVLSGGLVALVAAVWTWGGKVPPSAISGSGRGSREAPSLTVPTSEGGPDGRTSGTGDPTPTEPAGGPE